MEMQGTSVTANLALRLFILKFHYNDFLIRCQSFMAGPGFSEACRGRGMWITAQCSSTVLSWWLHPFWQALDCVWWWETAPSQHSATTLQLSTWIMETRRRWSVHQQTTAPINPSLKFPVHTSETYLTPSPYIVSYINTVDSYTYLTKASYSCLFTNCIIFIS